MILTLLVLVSGLIWATDSWFFKSVRQRNQNKLAANGDKLPVVVDYARSFFPIFLIVLLLRSFLVEPFRIPSGSMIPTLLVGDFILVNKFVYGIRLPAINRKVIELGRPRRGDVVVFRYPLDPRTPYIKRIVGLPGDVVEYRQKAVFINGDQVAYVSEGVFIGARSAAIHTGATLLKEKLGETRHRIIIRDDSRGRDQQFMVPEGHYFVLGDNRDNSRDSRFWGYVPEENLVGKAFFIWMNWDRGLNWDRIGTRIY